MMKHWPSAVAATLLLLVSAHGARAQEEITVIGPNIMRAPIEQFVAGFEMKTGHKVKATFGAEVGTRQQIMRGEADVPLVEAPDADVIASNSVVASSEKPVASISVGFAVRKGAPKPDISTPEALKRALLAAKSITYPDASA